LISLPRIEYQEKFVTIIVIGTMQGYTFITNLGPDSVMVGKDKPTFHASSHHMPAPTFLLIGIIITTSILFVFTPVLNQNHTAMAQQQQPNGNSFQMDKVMMVRP
jgi:hypothetical protein